MDNQNMAVEPKKSSPIGVIILVIILMIGCLVGGYFLNESGILSGDKKDTEEQEEKEPVVTNYEVTDAKVAKLIDNLDRGILDDSCKTIELYANDKKVGVNDITTQKAYRIAETDYYNSGKDSISLDEFTKTVQKYLGKDYNFNPADGMGKDKCMSYVYSAASKAFNKQETACGGTCGPRTNYKLVKAVDTDGTLVLSAKVIFASSDGFYSDYAKTNKIGSFEENNETLFSKGSDYKFTFKLEDGNYVFVSSEPAN